MARGRPRILPDHPSRIGRLPSGGQGMYAWYVVRACDGRVELVDGWESLDAVLAEMATSSWEEPDPIIG